MEPSDLFGMLLVGSVNSGHAESVCDCDGVGSDSVSGSGASCNAENRVDRIMSGAFRVDRLLSDPDSIAPGAAIHPPSSMRLLRCCCGCMCDGCQWFHWEPLIRAGSGLYVFHAAMGW